VMLTVLVIIKPSFNVSYQRNKQRLIGSLSGIGIGFSLMWLFPFATIQLALGVFFLLGFFSFGRTHYLTAVICITAMVVLCLNVYTGQNSHIVIERVYDTLIGCLIAFAASYLLPVWEGRKLKFYMSEVLRANISYLEKLRDQLSGTPPDVTTYKLSRKGVYINLAALAAAFTAMQTEPGRNIVQEENVYRFQVLSYNLSSVITSLFSAAKQPASLQQGSERVALVTKAIDILQEAAISVNSDKLFTPVTSNDLNEGQSSLYLSSTQLLFNLSRQLANVVVSQ